MWTKYVYFKASSYIHRSQLFLGKITPVNNILLKSKLPVQIFLSPPVVLLSFISRFALVR